MYCTLKTLLASHLVVVVVMVVAVVIVYMLILTIGATRYLGEPSTFR